MKSRYPCILFLLFNKILQNRQSSILTFIKNFSLCLLNISCEMLILKISNRQFHTVLLGPRFTEINTLKQIITKSSQ